MEKSFDAALFSHSRTPVCLTSVLFLGRFELAAEDQRRALVLEPEFESAKQCLEQCETELLKKCLLIFGVKFSMSLGASKLSFDTFKTCITMYNHCKIVSDVKISSGEAKIPS